MIEASEMLKRSQRYKTLCRNIFSSGDGKELMKIMKEVYCDCALFYSTDRETSYYIGQRDIVLELYSNVTFKEPKDVK